MLKIILLGYGKMGKAIDTIAEEHEAVVIKRIDSRSSNLEISLSDGDVIIDFTNRDAFIKNLPLLIETSHPIVVGTTGWNEDLDDVKRKVLASNSTMIFSANFSLGVQLFFRAVREVAKLISPFPQFDIAVSEIHHTEKLDSPSGTGLKIANEILSHCFRKTTLVFEHSKKKAPHELQLSSLRLGKVIGTHSVLVDSEFDEVTLTHNAKNRFGFAQGAIEVAHWINGKKGFFTIDDYLNDKLGKKS